MIRMIPRHFGQVQRRSDPEHALPVEASVRHQDMAVGIESEEVAKGLDGDDGAGVAPAHHRGVEEEVVLGPHVEEGRSLRGAQPLVAVADVDIGPYRFEVKWQLARRMGPVDDSEDPLPACPTADLSDRHDERGGRGDVAEVDHAGGGGDCAPQDLHHFA